MLQTSRTVTPDDPRLDQARRFVRQLEESLASTPRHLPVDGLDRIGGDDQTGTVTCVVDARGDFVDLRVRSDWWYTLGPSGVASAILDALQYAQDKAMLAMAVLRRHGRTLPAPPTGDRFQHDEFAARPGDIWAEWGAAEARVQRGYDTMAAADRVVETRDSAEPRTISGPRGLFHLTLVGFTVASAEVNPRIAARDADAIADDARATLRQATREKDPTYWFSGLFRDATTRVDEFGNAEQVR
ncbi:hypothetical protein GCM10022225_69190 [Plantactinospora mayteni]|uniref:YbaB/EbfC DNA-binding family protein n=1 Tax=Plantactinospora mayteni TaxID=566021 RepID=A0ABQ4F0V6_9ACTN|nr:hypothetical protein [Plantactinospora mayteni]GIH00498.1 hypothetical protein Pma05_70700 [Plantactinospora mayteni]